MDKWALQTRTNSLFSTNDTWLGCFAKVSENSAAHHNNLIVRLDNTSDVCDIPGAA
jgi:hypothetical protein